MRERERLGGRGDKEGGGEVMYSYLPETGREDDKYPNRVLLSI